jgi:hypothetical protein
LLIFLFGRCNTRAEERNICPHPTQWEKLNQSYKDLIGAVYDTALAYVREHRPDNELPLFTKLFDRATRMSKNIRCFASLYEAGKGDGIKLHSDWVSFCTVTVCLQGGLDSGEGLVIGTGSHEEGVDMETGYMYAYGRYPHKVDSCIRTKDRCTLNFFF